MTKTVFRVLGFVASLVGVGAAMAQTPWYTVLEQAPNPAVVTDAALRLKIVESGFPWRIQDIGTGIEMLLIPSDTFQMGASPGDMECYDNERPSHQVTLTNAFYMGKTEVTQAQWQAKMGSNPSSFSGYFDSPSRPVEQVSWNMIQNFNTATGLRLPTEAEWEFACRAGTTTAQYGLLNDIAWQDNNSLNITHTVGAKLPNALGLYDTVGNVWERCQDWFGPFVSGSVTNPVGAITGSHRLLRGGSYSNNNSASLNCRASKRNEVTPDETWNNSGFRVARTASPIWSISGVLPVSGPSTGGTAIRINGTSGTNFPNPPEVTIGGVAATDIVWVSPTLITAVTPAGTPGMTVVAVNGASSESFYYRPSCDGDLDNNGTIDSSDLGLMLVNYGNCYESLATPQEQEPLIFQTFETPSPLLLNKK
jgi:formylglycine-generating enzyme required for sulfatase activity